MNRLVIIVANLKPAKMRGIESQGMVLVASDPSDPMKKELISPPSTCQPGDIVSIEGLPAKPDAVLNPKKKIFEAVKELLKTNDACEATWDGRLMVTAKGPVSSQSVKNGGIS